jgi:hypothetical protein
VKRSRLGHVGTLPSVVVLIRFSLNNLQYSILRHVGEPMTNSARSFFVFGIYMLLLGTIVVLAPNFLLSLFHLPTTDEVWIRVVGMLVIFLGVYDIVAAKGEMKLLIQWSIPVRCSVILFFAVFVVAGLVPPILLLFGAVDFAGAVWTWIALRADSRSSPPQTG